MLSQLSPLKVTHRITTMVRVVQQSEMMTKIPPLAKLMDAMRDAYTAYETYAMGEFTLILMLTAIRMTPCFVYSYRVRRAPAADQTR